jgi:hypothetical protein
MKAVAIKKGQSRERERERERQISRTWASFGVIVAVRSSSSFMTPNLWTVQPLDAKRTGSKRFWPKNTNENGSTRIESNHRIRQPICKG